MAEFMIRFLICNISISFIIGIFLLAKHFLKKCLTSRAHYNLWFPLLGLLAVPFIPVQPIHFLHFFAWFGNLKNASSSPIGMTAEEAAPQIRYCKLDDRLEYIHQQKDTGSDWFDTVFPMVHRHFYNDCTDDKINALL